ncbi:CorA family divalent cation transporter [Marasmitruncus massiliensis]|uniref:magnesium transporter CorA family protein n=1 Tax=Marasmitruncus massiliensis TaxID=1944642 RepID=UPI000C7AFA41|nr:CorA family divalent cation transporter [Marasmitruncus massiliensis]
MLKLLLSTQTEQLSSYIDERTLTHIRYRQVNKFESYQEMDLISFDWYDIHNKHAKPVQVIIYFTRDYIFFICEGERCFKQVEPLVTEKATNEKTLYSFFLELLKGDIEHLEKLEEHITETEDELLKASRSACAEEIIAFRRELLRLKKYYEQLNQIFEGLTENENNLIPLEDLRYFRILDSKIDRLFSHVLNLRDYVTQVREAYQAQIDIEQNNLMKIFTVVTAVFLPLTLLVGWYGMNLRMPEFSWPYGYPFVIVLSIAVVTFCLFYFKRRKWF